MMNRKGLLSLLSLFFFPILIFIFALTLLFLPLPGIFPSVGSNERSLMAAMITGLLGLIWLVYLVFQVIRIVLIPGRLLDKIFTSKGLLAKSYLGLGRQYQGSLEGHQVFIQYIPGRMLQNMLLDFRLECDHSANLLISNGKPIAVSVQVDEEILSREIDGINVLAEDREFADSLLSIPETIQMIREAVTGQGVGLVEIKLKPGCLKLHTRPTFNLDADNVEIWLQVMLKLSRVIENMN